MKKKIGILCLAAVFVFALAGCGSGGGGDQSESETLKLAKECTVETGIHVDCDTEFSGREEVCLKGDKAYLGKPEFGYAYVKNSEGAFRLEINSKTANSYPGTADEIQAYVDASLESLGLNRITEETKFEMSKEKVGDTEYDVEMFKDGEVAYKYYYDGDKKLCYVKEMKGDAKLSCKIYALDNNVDESKFVIPADYKVNVFER